MARSRKARDEPASPEAPTALRLDRWLWFARFQRSREACAELARAGHVRLNGRRVLQPGAPVRIGDVLTLALPGRTVVVAVRALGLRRGGTAEAASLFAPLAPSSFGGEQE